VGKANVLFYLTGDDHVADLDTNGYAPGAVADHLTSCGGALHRSCQMEITAWLQAGATASYGSVNEGCNFTSKFPRASVLVKSYFKGETLIESYWRSVNMVGQGLFIGEPLARPFAETLSPLGGGRVRLTVATLRRGLQYALQTAPQGGGAFQTLEVVAGDDTRAHQLDFTPQPGAVYRLVVLRPVAPSLALAITKRGPWQLIASGAAPGQQVRLFDAAGCPAGTNPRVATADASGQARFQSCSKGAPAR
jgi:hypothetical protein